MQLRTQLLPDGERCLYRFGEPIATFSSVFPIIDSPTISPSSVNDGNAITAQQPVSTLKSSAPRELVDVVAHEPLSNSNPKKMVNVKSEAWAREAIAKAVPTRFNLSSSASSPAAKLHRRENFSALWAVTKCCRFSVTCDDSDSFISFRMPQQLRTSNNVSLERRDSGSTNSTNLCVAVVPILRIEYSDSQRPLPVSIPLAAELFPHVRATSVIMQQGGRLTIYGLFDELSVVLEQEPVQVRL